MLCWPQRKCWHWLQCGDVSKVWCHVVRKSGLLCRQITRVQQHSQNVFQGDQILQRSVPILKEMYSSENKNYLFTASSFEVQRMWTFFIIIEKLKPNWLPKKVQFVLSSPSGYATVWVLAGTTTQGEVKKQWCLSIKCHIFVIILYNKHPVIMKKPFHKPYIYHLLSRCDIWLLHTHSKIEMWLWQSIIMNMESITGTKVYCTTCLTWEWPFYVFDTGRHKWPGKR